MVEIEPIPTSSRLDHLLDDIRLFDVNNMEEVVAGGLDTEQYKQLIEQLQGWIVRLRLLTSSAAFARQALVDEVSTGAKDVDRVVAEGTTTGLLAANVPMVRPKG